MGEIDDVSIHQPHDCILNRLFRRRSKKTSKLRVTGLCAGNSPVIGEFPAQRASNAEFVSIWWRHHDYWLIVFCRLAALYADIHGLTIWDPRKHTVGCHNIVVDNIMVFHTVQQWQQQNINHIWTHGRHPMNRGLRSVHYEAFRDLNEL